MPACFFVDVACSAQPLASSTLLSEAKVLITAEVIVASWSEGSHPAAEKKYITEYSWSMLEERRDKR